MALTLQDLQPRRLLLFESISGSKAYGLSTPASDTDIRGVFVLPETDFLGLDNTQQLNNDTNDVVFYELKRFAELLAKNNPNMLEMLAMPAACILFKHPLYDFFRPELFLSRLCRNTFAGYALAQIKKAKGLHKKIVNPIEPDRRSILDFCFVAKGQGSVPVQDFLTEKRLDQSQCGLAKIPHMPDLYALFYAPGLPFKGLAPNPDASDVSLSSIPKELEPLAVMAFNKNGYSTYCKEYRDYWEWVEKRNEERYKNTLSHGKNYDAKNLMHTFRLLDMAEEIGRTGRIIVRRPNREFLLKIRNGEFDYAELVAMAEERIDKMDELYAYSDLPETPDFNRINEVLMRVRQEFYRLGGNRPAS